MTRWADLIIPPAALDLPRDWGRVREVLRHDAFTRDDATRGWGPYAIDLTTGAEVPLPRWHTEGVDPSDTGESEDVLVVRPLDDLRHVPGGPGSDVDRAVGLLAELDGGWTTPAGEWSPRRWLWLDRVSSRLYVLGIGTGGGCTWDRWGRLVALHYPRLCLPVRRYPTPWSPDRTHRWTLRPYLLGRRDWWWLCLWTQLRGGNRWHRPGPEGVAGICGRCLPCPECGDPDLDCRCYSTAAVPVVPTEET